MRPDHVRLGVLAVAALFVSPCSALAQTTTNTDAAIAELRQLLAEQRAALDRQARIIEEQGRILAALQQRDRRGEPATTHRSPRPAPAAVAAVETQITPRSRPVVRPLSRRRICQATVVSAGDFPGSIRIPGTESAFKLGGQARLVAVHTLSALGTEDKFVTSSIPVGAPRAGEDARTVYSPTASRLSTELRMPSPRGPMRMFIESDFAGAGRTMRLRHAFLQTNRFVVGQTWSTFSRSGGRHHWHRLRRPERHLAVPATAVSLDAEQHRVTLPVGIGPRESRARSHRCPGRQLHARLRRAVAIRAGPQNADSCFTRVTCRRRCWSGSCAAKCQANPRSRSRLAGIGGTSAASWSPAGMQTTASSLPSNAGSGIGRYIADLSSLGGQDAVYDPVQGSLRALPVASGYIGYEHAWSRVFTTAVTYGVVNVSNLDIQPGRRSTRPSGHRSI